jgi:uncharacterized protein (TIGR03435 family)
MSIVSRKLALSLLRPPVLCLVFCAGMQALTQADVAQSPTPVPASQSSNEVPKIPAFDVISVKQNLAAQGWHDAPTADGYLASAVTLQWILPEAYGLSRSSCILGTPGWANTYRYDIEAKVADADVAALQKLDWKQRNQMIQQILMDRFKVRVHHEDQTQPIYSLVVVRKDRLPPPADPQTKHPNGFISRSRNGQLTAGSFTMAAFADFISGSLGRKVVDKTGLAGRYDFKLDWNPDEIDSSGSDNSAPSIFTATQEQLGLKLVPTTGPVDCLVVDHVELPSEN